MTHTLQYNDYRIELFDDPSYVDSSVDSPTQYDLVYKSDKDAQYILPTKHGIKIYTNGQLFRSAILLAAGGGTGISINAALLDDGNLIIRCSNTVYSLTLPDLRMNWLTEADWSTCFSIHKYKDTYITHGEISIARIDKNGKVLWNISGADIFVTLYEGTPFEMKKDHIALTDFNGRKYKIDYNGNYI